METWKPPKSSEVKPTDIIIVLDGCKFHLHKDVLIKNCDYFKAMFSSQMSESWQSEIKVKIVEKEPFQVLVCGFYSGNLEVSEENIFAVSAAAHIIQVTSPLSTQCCDFLRKLINHNCCFDVMHFTALYPIDDFYNHARSYCLNHFLTLREEESFLNLSLNDLKNYLLDEYLVADGTWEILVALKNWSLFNNLLDLNSLKDIISSFLHCEEEHLSQECEDIAAAIISGDDFLGEKWAYLGSRRQKKDAFVFWAQLSNTDKRMGLVDLIRLGDLEPCPGTIQGSSFDTMTTVVKDPGFDLGSAVCVKGPHVYLSGGGPSFGKMNWTRDIWVFSSFEDDGRWRKIGKMTETRRYHVMVAVDEKLYIFGGFGKFRTKNTLLESFDIKNGLWQSLAPMPVHSIKPKAKSHHQTIYFSLQWEVYEYSVKTDQWSVCQKVEEFKGLVYTQREYPFTCQSHLALHITCCESERNSIRLTKLITDHLTVVHLVSYSLSERSQTSVKYQYLEKVTYFGSFSTNGKVFIFLQAADEVDSSEIQVLSFNPGTGKLEELATITNVLMGSNIVPVTYVPKSSHIIQPHHTVPLK